MQSPPARELWVEKIENPTTRERTKRKLFRAYEIDGDIVYGSTEVYEKLHELGYDLSYYEVNHLVNDYSLTKRNKDRYPELDPDNPNGFVKLISKGQYYEQFKRHRTEAKFLLVYYFENLEHTRFYGVTCFLLDRTYVKFQNMLQYLDADQDISHYTFNSVSIVETNGRFKKAYDVMDKAIFDYLVENPTYEAYNLDLLCHV